LLERSVFDLIFAAGTETFQEIILEPDTPFEVTASR
jgi:hypothetical protein